MSNPMKASDILIKGIKSFEGLRLEAYQDAKGVWTIGFGHTANVSNGTKGAAEYHLFGWKHQVRLGQMFGAHL